MNTYARSFVNQMRGRDLEGAFASAFGGNDIGGFDDGGLDVTTGDHGIPAVQVKSSLEGLKSFLAESVRRKKFIPVCVGEPGARDEMLKHLKQFGAWMGSDIPNRDKNLTAVAQVRSMCRA